jgi:uracil-DNA glycosylase
MKPNEFVCTLQALTFDAVFNPYSDRCPVHDVKDAPRRRADILLALLRTAANSHTDSLWIGRDLGYRGGRRTGLALTDDVHLSIHATRWNVEVKRATKGAMVAERTAAVIWGMLALVSVPVFLWNVFPLHPHEPNHPFTNRSHKPHERRAGEEILAELIILLRPRQLVAIGNDAAKSATRLAGSANVVQVRHPSYGGQRDFIRQISDLYGVNASDKQSCLL